MTLQEQGPTILETPVLKSKQPIKNQEAAKTFHDTADNVFLDDYVQKTKIQLENHLK